MDSLNIGWLTYLPWTKMACIAQTIILKYLIECFTCFSSIVAIAFLWGLSMTNMHCFECSWAMKRLYSNVDCWYHSELWIDAFTPPTKSYRSLAPMRITGLASSSKSNISQTKCRRVVKFCLNMCHLNTNNRIYIYIYIYCISDGVI